PQGRSFLVCWARSSPVRTKQNTWPATSPTSKHYSPSARSGDRATCATIGKAAGLRPWRSRNRYGYHLGFECTESCEWSSVGPKRTRREQCRDASEKLGVSEPG